MVKIFGFLWVFFFLLATFALAKDAVLLALPQPVKRPPQTIVVKLKPGGALPAELHASLVPQLAVQKIPVPEGQSAADLAARWQQDPQVEWAQPNYWRYALATEITPDDPYYRPERNQRQYQQWHLFKINANFAWSISRGQDDLMVAVIDTGIDLNHPELKSRLVKGITIVNQDKYFPPADGMDDDGHGTHIAGLIGASTDNHLGIAGCAWKGKLMPVKVLNKSGEGNDADIAAGIIWAADHGARILNLSLGSPMDDNNIPQLLADAINYAYARGCLVIAAAGNSGDNTRYFPAVLPHVVSVAATDPQDRRAAYSTYGPELDLAAPGGAAEISKGTGIFSTYWSPASQITDFMGGSEAGEYAIAIGTSMAAALVSGAALVIWAEHSEYSPDQIEQVMKSTAVDIGVPGPDSETGAGRIDLLAALGTASPELSALTLYNYPNPFNPDQDHETKLVFILEAPSGVEVKIFDAARDLVWQRTLAASETLAGKNVIAWDGRNGAGERVANGAYYYRVTNEQGQASRTKVIAVLR